MAAFSALVSRTRKVSVRPSPFASFGRPLFGFFIPYFIVPQKRACQTLIICATFKP
jgi:hypothetical protein